MAKTTKTILVKSTNVNIINCNGEDYICITDIARTKNSVEPKDVVKNWMRSKATIEFLILWEKLNNETLKGVDFDPLKTMTEIHNHLTPNCVAVQQVITPNEIRGIEMHNQLTSNSVGVQHVSTPLIPRRRGRCCVPTARCLHSSHSYPELRLSPCTGLSIFHAYGVHRNLKRMCQIFNNLSD
ncbi:MAG: KilA-N domain-containing protein [Bacteroidales bacterium]|jgi:hypothetical protein|nr:KilA-N domain-containing protein [Bacteroidales bacterium]